MKSNIAIYWWAFNPPTLGHLHVIEQVFLLSDITQIIIVPDGPRDDKNYAIEDKHRINLIYLFIQYLEKYWFNIEIDTQFLKNKKSNTTTREVDKYFIHKLGFQPYHIFWTDVSHSIDKWSWNPGMYIQKKLKKIFVPREWYKFIKNDLENYILINTNKTSSISSTLAKENIKKVICNKNILMNNINDYIKKNNVYSQ